MGSGPGHSHVFFVHAESGVHRLAPECKVVATVLFVFAVVATPREAIWAFALDAVILARSSRSLAHVPFGRLARRWLIEVPFLAFAVFLPFVGHGPYVEVGFLTLSEPGLWGAWNIVVKGTIGVAAILAADRDHHRPRTAAGAGPAAGADSRWSASRASWSGTARCWPMICAGCGSPGCPAVTTRAGSGRCAASPGPAGALFVRSYERGRTGVRGDAGQGLRVRAGSRLDTGGRRGGLGDGVDRAVAAGVICGVAAGRCPDRARGGQRKSAPSSVDRPGGPSREASRRGCGDTTAGLLEVRDLAFAYPDGRQVLYGVNLAVRRGSGWPSSGPTAPARRPWCCT